MNFITQLGVLAIIFIILIILIKSNQTLEKIYMEEPIKEKQGIDIEIPKWNVKEVKLPKWSFKNSKTEDEEEAKQTVKRPVERSSGTMPVNTISKWSVEILDDRGRVIENHKIYQYPFSIGRSEDNDLVLDDLSVSGHHAAIEDVYGALELQDLGSLNKILVQGKVVDKIELNDLLEADFGNTRLRFRKEGKKSNPTIAYERSSLMEEWH